VIGSVFFDWLTIWLPWCWLERIFQGSPQSLLVIPAKAGIQRLWHFDIYAKSPGPSFPRKRTAVRHVFCAASQAIHTAVIPAKAGIHFALMRA
jgi:hypothetical protein